MQLTNLTSKEILKKCIQLISENGCKNIVTLNSLMLKHSWHDRKLAKAIKKASMITADSIGVCVASILLNGKKSREKNTLFSLSFKNLPSFTPS